MWSKRTLGTLLVLVLVAAACAPVSGEGEGEDAGASEPEGVVGSWGGQVSEPGATTFDACLTITQTDTPGEAGTSSYVLGSGGECAGALTFREEVDGAFWFDETVDSEGDGCADGAVRLELFEDYVEYDWYLPDDELGDGYAGGALDRVDACGGTT
jgi:hypothetical protein